MELKNQENQERVKGRSRRKGSQTMKVNQTVGDSRAADIGQKVSTDQTGTTSQAVSVDQTASTSQAIGIDRQEPVSRREENSVNVFKIAAAAGCLLLSLTVAGGVVYTLAGKKYDTVFFPKTMINGIDASGRTPDEVKEMIAGQVKGYALTLDTRQDTKEIIKGTEIDLHPEYDGTLEQLLSEQVCWKWGVSAMKEKAYTIGTMVKYDQNLLEHTLDQLDCMNQELVQAPVDAALSEYIPGIGYQIVPEEQGNLLNREKLLLGVSDAISNLQETLDLEEIDAYEVPMITADNPELLAKQEAWNHYVNTTVTYQFGNKREVLDGSVIHQWISDDGQGGARLDENQVTEYVKTLAREYNTAYQPKTLKTSYGKTVTVTGGPYGWRINQTAEAAALTEILHSGESQTREPVYSQTANSHDGPDYGNTYVEINLTAQHLYFYKDGKLVVESDFVSGNASKGWATPAGAYPLTYKQRDAVLRGENYETPVSYWMPFNGNIGMHDASWRGSFGGTIYKTNGSHGCVNLPPAVAKTIYENISAGMPVLCYHLDGTGSGTSSTTAKPTETTAAETKPAETTAAETQPAETTAAETQPAETTAAETKPAETAADETQPAETTAAETQPAETPAAETNPSTSPTPKTETTPTPPTQTTPTPGIAAGPSGTETAPSSGVVSGPGQ
ncbi:MAG: L,D-transpeptidase family protein [Brotaphodocola sp.]